MKDTELLSGSAPKQARPAIHYGYIVVACCCLMMGVNVGLTFSCAGIFYRPVSESLGVPIGEFGLYMSIMYVTSSLMLPLAGKMMERWSARWLLTGSSLVMGLTFGCMALLDNVWGFYIAGGVLGVTLAFLLYLSFPTLVNRWFTRKVGLMMGICSAASGIGGVIFNPLAGWMISEWGWRWAYGGFAVLIIGAVCPILALLLRDWPEQKGCLPFGAESASENVSPRDKGGRQKSSTKVLDGFTYKEALRSPLFYGVVAFAFIMMGTSTLNLFIPGYVGDHGFSLEQTSLAAAAVMVGVTLGKLILGWVNDRNCSLGVSVTTGFGMIGLLGLLVGSVSLGMIMGGAFLFGWAYAGVTVQTAMLTRTVFGTRDYGRIYAVVSIALAAGGAVASGGWGLLADATSTAFAFEIGIGCLGLCALIGLWALRAKKPQLSKAR